jgi:serine/threonine protein kinase
MLFEMFSGNPPYEADTPMGLAVKHITEPIPRLSEVRPDLPSSYEKLINRAMCKEPEGRFPSTGEMAREFATVLEEKETVDIFDDITTVEPLPPEPVIEKPEVHPDVELEEPEPEPEPTVIEPIVKEAEPLPPAEIEIPPPIEAPVKPRLKIPRIKLDRMREILLPFVARLRQLPLWTLIGGTIVLISLGIGINFLPRCNPTSFRIPNFFDCNSNADHPSESNRNSRTTGNSDIPTCGWTSTLTADWRFLLSMVRQP